jgi:serine/threonine-protein kinase
MTPEGEALPDPMMGLQVGDYLVVDLVGAGGMGRVYLGLQLPLLMPAAVKLLALEHLPGSLHDELRSRFESEARALAVLQHPNVVRLLQYGTVFRQPYLVMEFVSEGVTLHEDVRRRAMRGARYAVDELRAVLGQTLDGLGAAHALGIVHRDVKPANLMLQSVVGHPLFVRILDFGLAKFLHTGAATFSTAGTPDYMAPEQARGETMGPWTDLYALGVVAFELLTGMTAFPGHDGQEVLARKLDPEWNPTDRIGPLGFPEPVLAFLHHALHPDPSRRYRNHEAMRLGLHRALDALASAPNDPLAGVHLGGLVWTDASPTPMAVGERPRAAPASGRPTPHSDEALRRWLDREQSRLAEAARKLRSRG